MSLATNAQQRDRFIAEVHRLTLAIEDLRLEIDATIQQRVASAATLIRIVQSDVHLKRATQELELASNLIGQIQ